MLVPDEKYFLLWYNGMLVGSELRLYCIVIYMFGDTSCAASHKCYSGTKQLN